jgi:protein-disulfide isomerase
MRKSVWAAVLVGVVALTATPAWPQAPGEIEALRREIEALKAQQQSIRKELSDIKELLRGRQPASQEIQPTRLLVGGYPAKGERGARLTVVEFSDYECPFCARHVRQTLPQLEDEYVKTGKVRYVIRNFPLESIHKKAFRAAEAALCAGEQGKYWEMHDRLFASQGSLEDLPGHAQAVELEPTGFAACHGSGRHAALIRQDLTDGRHAGIRGTPAFFIGLADPTGETVLATKAITGAVPYKTFKETLDALLADAERGGPPPAR